MRIGFFAFMAELDGEIVSFGGMVIKKIPGDFNQSMYLEGDILNMYTIPAARRKGISAQILEHLITEARRRGISKTFPPYHKRWRKTIQKIRF